MVNKKFGSLVGKSSNPDDNSLYFINQDLEYSKIAGIKVVNNQLFYKQSDDADWRPLDLVQSNYGESDSSQPDYIRNKPDLSLKQDKQTESAVLNSVMIDDGNRNSKDSNILISDVVVNNQLSFEGYL